MNSPWLFLPSFIVFWCFICFFLSRVSGWASLATHYATSEKPRGEKYSVQSIGLGYSDFFAVSYSGVVTFHLSDETLHMKVMPLFTVGHAKLSIPLADIEAEPSRFLFSKNVKISFKKSGNIKMRVFRSLGKNILHAKFSRSI
ncbi:MAG: hypothetical protein ABJO36_14275 [Litorimonas sp.]